MCVVDSVNKILRHTAAVAYGAHTLQSCVARGGSAARRGGAVYREFCKPAGPARVPIHYSRFVVLGLVFFSMGSADRGDGEEGDVSHPIPIFTF